MSKFKTLREIVAEVEPTMRCNCDLDNWEPQRDTGHSWVCRIHKEAKALCEKEYRRASNFLQSGGGLP